MYVTKALARAATSTPAESDVHRFSREQSTAGLARHIIWTLGLCALLSFFTAGCLTEPVSVDTEEQEPVTQDPVSMTVVSMSADSVDVEARWSMVSDPSGISHYEWINWRTHPDTIVAYDQTSLQADTLSVGRPGLNETLTFGFQIRAVDNAGNVGVYSQPHMWSLSNADTVPPPPPDTIVVDTLVASIQVWPDSFASQTGEQVQLYAAMLLIETRGQAVDSIYTCDIPPAVPGARYESGTFCCGCDSAVAALQRALPSSTPLLLTQWRPTGQGASARLIGGRLGLGEGDGLRTIGVDLERRQRGRPPMEAG